MKVGQRAQEGFQVNKETREQRETTVCQVPGEYQAVQESQAKMVPEVTLVMQDQEEILEYLDQRETQGDLALATLDQEDNRVTEEGRATVGLVVAEETVVRRASLEIKELQEIQASQDLLVNLAIGDQEEELVVMEVLDLREILALPNVMS